MSKSLAHEMSEEKKKRKAGMPLPPIEKGGHHLGPLTGAAGSKVYAKSTKAIRTKKP